MRRYPNSERLSHESERFFEPAFAARLRELANQNETRMPTVTFRPISGAASLMKEVAE